MPTNIVVLNRSAITGSWVLLSIALYHLNLRKWIPKTQQTMGLEPAYQHMNIFRVDQCFDDSKQ